MYGRPQKQSNLIDDDDEEEEEEAKPSRTYHRRSMDPPEARLHQIPETEHDDTAVVVQMPLWGKKPERSKCLEDDDVLDDRQMAFVEDTALLVAHNNNTTESTTATPAHDNDDDDDEELKAAILESQRQQQEEKEASLSQVAAFSGKEVEEVKENARTLRSLSATSNESVEFLHTLLGMCKDDQKRVAQAIEDSMRADTINSEELEVLFDLNSNILEAVQRGESRLGVRSSAASAAGVEMATSPTIRDAEDGDDAKPKAKSNNVNLDVQNLVLNLDIFSLICMLRVHHNEKRLDAAVALMQFARDAEKGDKEFIRIREEIRSSGGMHSFLTLFRTTNTSHQLKVVSSLAVSYVLPSFVESGYQSSPSLCLKIVECLRFLVSAEETDHNGEVFTHEDMFDAAAKALTTFWVSHIEPSLHSEKAKKLSTVEMKKGLLRHSSWGRQRGRLMDQREEGVAATELLEVTVSLILHVTNEESENHLSCKYGQTLIEQVCAVESARPIAVRRGILQILVGWIRSGDREKIGPAVSALRYVTAVNDKYMAGWIHSEMVNKGAVQGLVELTHDISATPDIRLAIAQILSSLCAAPHTRAAVVEAKCVKFLISMLYEYNDRLSKDVAFYAGNAILQLASGAMTRASWAMNGEVEVSEYISNEERDSMVGEIVDSGAIAAFVSISRSCRGKLASVAIRALRVISEDVSPTRQTRLQLCEDNAAIALGVAMKHSFGSVSTMLKTMPLSMNAENETSLRSLHEALCALSNILDPSTSQVVLPTTRTRSVTSSSSIKDAHILLTKGCLDTAQSGGLETLLEIVSLPADLASVSPNMELLDEACRSLSFLSPILLSPKVSSAGYSKWAHDVWVALHSVLERLSKLRDAELTSDAQYLYLSALNGLGALATSEPLKVRIIEKTLPLLLEALNNETNPDVSTAAIQAFQSLNLSQDEASAQVLRNSSGICAELFCLQRSFLLQDMVQAELRRQAENMWKAPIKKALRRLNDGFSVEDHPFGGSTLDSSSSSSREALVDEYNNVYGERYAEGSLLSEISRKGRDHQNSSLLSQQTYPMCSSDTEIEWILEHGQTMIGSEVTMPELSDHTKKLLSVCFPSSLLKDEVAPVDTLRSHATVYFRALMMAKRKYFSFRREGQLVVSLVDRESGLRGQGQLHCTLGFTNSEFGGEFAESLVQVLYKCPLICGLSFVKDENWEPFNIEAGDAFGDIRGEPMLANLMGSLPRWISHLTFDGVFNDAELSRLVLVLESMGRLTTAQQGGSDISDGGQRFCFLALINCPSLSTKVWSAFFKLFGDKPEVSRGIHTSALAQLRSLDLSGNQLGDELCSSLLGVVLDDTVGCSLEELDLSGNRINGGSMVVKTLRDYLWRIRKKISKNDWKSALSVLRLASNGFVGKTWLEILSILMDVGLPLRTLDFSSNSLVLKDGEYDVANIVVQALTHREHLELLDLSRNRFSSPIVDHILRQIAAGESCNAVLLLKENHPPLSVQQSAALRSASLNGRTKVAKRYIEKREKKKRLLSPLSDFSTSQNQSEREFVSERSSTNSMVESSLPIPEPTLGQAENSITVLFSAPLVYTDGRTLRPFAKLDFDLERELMWQCLKEASRDIELSFDSATHERLLATMAKRCSCLHYSGHGHQQYLPFEDGSGGPYWFKVDQFKSLIENEGGAPFRFVFVSACYSYLAGETFASAGVPHVVCCQQESELKDTAALAFTRQFYLALAIGHTVRVSFDQGCKAVRATPNLKNPDIEMKKFLLLPENGNHDIPIFNAKPVSEWPTHLSSGGGRNRKKPSMGARSSELSVRNMMQEDPSPSPPESFLGREVDMYYTLKAVLEKRLVSVTGEPGVGRSSLVCALCHYINERATTVIGIEHIYHIKARKSQKRTPLRSLVQRLLDKLCAQNKSPLLSEAGDDFESMFDEICRILKHARVLIVFDRVEHIMDTNEAHEFPMLLSKLSRETKNVKVLLTNRQELGIPSLGEHPISLGPLNFANTVRLFANICPYLHTPVDRKKLFETLITDSEEAELLATDPGVGFARKDIFRRLGDGIPSKIEKAAYELSKEEFLALYKSPSHDL